MNFKQYELGEGLFYLTPNNKITDKDKREIKAILGEEYKDFIKAYYNRDYKTLQYFRMKWGSEVYEAFIH